MDKHVLAFAMSLPVDTFSIYGFADLFEIFSGQFASKYPSSGKAYLTHLAFGRTENDAKKRLDKLGWREYANSPPIQLPEKLSDQVSEQLPNGNTKRAAVQQYLYIDPSFWDQPFWDGMQKH